MPLKRSTKRLLFVFLLLSGVSVSAAYEAQVRPSVIQLIQGTEVWPVSCAGCSWNKSFKPEVTLNQSWTVSSVVWSSDGKYLAVGSGFEGIISVYDTKTWNLISKVDRVDIGGNNSIVRFIDDDKALILPRIRSKDLHIGVLTINDSVSLEKWDIARNQVVQKYYAHFPDEDKQTWDRRREASIARAVAVSQVSHLVAASLDSSDGVLIYNETNAQVIQDIHCTGGPESLAFSPDGKDIAIGGCFLKNVSVYIAKTGEKKFQKEVVPETWQYNPIEYNPSGTLIAVASYLGEHGVVTVLNASDGSVVSTSPSVHATITNLQWLTNQLVFTSYDFFDPDGSAARLWDASSMRLLGEIGGNELNIAAINPDGTRLAAVIGKDVIVGNLK